jgi:hypothetical protein
MFGSVTIQDVVALLSGGLVSKTYVVKAGDTLSGIAHKNGYKSWEELYSHPENQAFRTKRPNPNSIFPGDVLILPDAGPSAPMTPSPGWTFNLFKNSPITQPDLFKLDQILQGPLPGRNDPLWDISKALKDLGPAAKNSNTIDDLAKKIQSHMQIRAGDWTIKPDLGTIGKGLLELFKKK